jgi:hypothetical protein
MVGNRFVKKGTPNSKEVRVKKRKKRVTSLIKTEKLSQNDIRDLLYRVASERKEDLIDALNELITKSKSDKAVLFYLLDQLIGRAPQTTEVTGKDGSNLDIRMIVEAGTRQEEPEKIETIKI